MKAIALPFVNIKDRPHIILTGFMGAGKTTVGQLLAERLERPFVDTDRHLEAQTGMPAGQYMRRFGEVAFRKIESRCLNVALQSEPAVIATGGGTILSRFNRKRMLVRGWVCWLATPAVVLERRLKNLEDRPLLVGKDPKVALKKMLWERIPLYEECHHHIDTAFKTPQQVLEEIVKTYAQRVAG